jgi:Ca-activated chloride channel family protein
VIDQIVRLSIRYGIVTPYTSYLVTEAEVLGADALEGIVAEEYQRILAAPTQVSGQAAVEQSAAASAFGDAAVPLAPPSDAADLVRVAGSRAFRRIDGVWIDTAYDPDSMTTLKVAFASDDYFALTAARPELAAAFAMGERVIVMYDGVAYEVVGSDQPSDPITLPPPASLWRRHTATPRRRPARRSPPRRLRPTSACRARARWFRAGGLAIQNKATKIVRRSQEE